MDILNDLRSVSHRMQDGRELAEYLHEKLKAIKDIRHVSDVFDLCRILEVKLVPTGLKEIDGIYLAEREVKGKKKNAVIALNTKKNNIRRLKFTLLHEICHHIKDYDSLLQPTILDIDKEEVELPYSRKEIFANEFASYFLIPNDRFKEQIKKVRKTKLTNEHICELADYFEVSCSAIKKRLKSLEIDYKEGLANINSEIDVKLKLQFIKQIAQNVQTVFSKFQRTNIANIVINDSRFELSELDESRAYELVFDVKRLQELGEDIQNEYDLTKNDIEVLGLMYIYNELLKDEQKPNEYALKKYHCNLYKFAPSYSNGYRNSNNVIVETELSTTDYTRIGGEMYQLFGLIDWVFEQNNNEIELFEYLAITHQKITKIHPFNDGNGRISRFLLNWMLQVKNFPYIFIEVEKRNDYLKALAESDSFNYSSLIQLFVDSIYNNYNQYICEFLDN